MVDFGDAPILPADPVRSHEAIQATVAQVLAAGAIPIILGGDHSIAEPDIRACAEVHGPVGLIHFDTHTDTGREVVADPDAKPGVTNLLTIHSALSGRSVADLEEHFAGRGYGDLKKELAEVVTDFVTPVRERTQELLGDPAELQRVLAQGAARAREVATGTVAEVYERIGFLPGGGRA